MQIAILGGTGDIGAGLALRWANDTPHEIRIGSRAAEKAEDAVAEYHDRLDAKDGEISLVGLENSAAATDADVVILAAPPYHVSSLLDSVRDQLAPGTIVVSPAVGMTRDDDGFHYDPPQIGSLTELVAARAPETVSVVGAYHNIPANRLADLDAPLDIDTLIVADDAAAKQTIIALTNEIRGLRAIDGGRLANAAEIESVTPVILNVVRQNEEMHDIGVRFA